MTDIHPLACVDPKAELGNGVIVSPFAVIEAGAVIGDNCSVGPQALVTSWARIGNDVKIHKGAVVGTDPQDLKFGGEETVLEVGDRTVIREFATLNRGTKASGRTRIGSDVLIMAYVHVAHDCRVGNHVILANAIAMGGHVEIGDWVIIGGLVGIHQFVRIGEHSLIGGGFRVIVDVPPYVIAAELPLKYKGINSIGLKRRGLKKDTIHTIQSVYRTLYRKGMNISEAMQVIKKEYERTPEVMNIIDFIEKRDIRTLLK